MTDLYVRSSDLLRETASTSEIPIPDLDVPTTQVEIIMPKFFGGRQKRDRDEADSVPDGASSAWNRVPDTTTDFPSLTASKNPPSLFSLTSHNNSATGPFEAHSRSPIAAGRGNDNVPYTMGTAYGALYPGWETDIAVAGNDHGQPGLPLGAQGLGAGFDDAVSGVGSIPHSTSPDAFLIDLLGGSLVAADSVTNAGGAGNAGFLPDYWGSDPLAQCVISSSSSEPALHLTSLSCRNRWNWMTDMLGSMGSSAAPSQ